MRTPVARCSIFAFVLGILTGCGSDPPSSSADGGVMDDSGGAPGSGAGGALGSGDGGAHAGTGGRPNSGGTPAQSGGATNAGGATMTGGGTHSGGRTNSGGAATSGGAAGAGGSRSDGGIATDGGGDSGAAGYPDETTTGPDLSACPGGKLQKYAAGGDYRPKTNEVVTCMEFDDHAIYVPAEVSSVTIENCRFVTTADRFVNIQGSHVTIQDSEFIGPAETWIRNSYSGDHLTVRRNEFTGMGNAVEFNVGYETLEDNYVHDFGTANPDQHADGLQTDGTSHAVIRHNTVLLNDVAGATGAISIFGNSGDDVLIQGNKVAGGGYTVYAGGKGFTNIRAIDNCFSTQFYPGKAQSGAYGPWYPSDNFAMVVRTGNTWCDGPKAGQALNENP